MEYDNGARAIQGITLTIEDGEFVFLVGPSGSGKSTLIKLLTGEVMPSFGRVMINGFSIVSPKDRQIPMMRRTLGVVFQDFRLIDRKTVFENLSFVMRAVGAGPAEIRERIPRILGLVELEDKMDRYPPELSGGEQQRVAIARALVNNPVTLIADEPTGNLDPDRSLEVMRLLIKINQMGTTVVVVTHERELVNRFGKRVIVIDEGIVTRDAVGRYSGGRHGKSMSGRYADGMPGGKYNGNTSRRTENISGRYPGTVPVHYGANAGHYAFSSPGGRFSPGSYPGGRLSPDGYPGGRFS